MLPSQHQPRAKTKSISHSTHPPDPMKQKLSGVSSSREDIGQDLSASPFTSFDAALSSCKESLLQMVQNRDYEQLKQNLQAMDSVREQIEQQLAAQRAEAFSTLLEQKDLWITDILPLVGMGQYAFVGGVNKQMKELYEKLCSTVKDAPLVRHQNHKKIPATSNQHRYRS
ncbi:expressed unknown protein [Seminavis robusta]|uniref:Uncharacterized protein n=1 Tax=Seminavis robusta TaxID=568900 RepID=A0A9N8EXF8_9STRA|nr:expressed unknown protein [Seminavis robusta]|eukprot:Sro2380_g325430.1 n/a (170) ;mRNA; f:5510-6019